MVRFFPGIPASLIFPFTFLFLSLSQEIYKDRKKFSRQVFEVASSDLVNMGITVVSYTLKDVRDDMVNADEIFFVLVFERPVLFGGWVNISRRMSDVDWRCGNIKSGRRQRSSCHWPRRVGFIIIIHGA